MEIKTFFQTYASREDYCKTTVLNALKEAFFKEKETFVLENNQGKTIKKTDPSNLPVILKNIFPSATIYDLNPKCRCGTNKIWFMQLPNVDITINRKDCKLTIDDLITRDFNDLHNSIEYLKEINDSIPVWRAEFKEFCEKSDAIIQQEETKRQLFIVQKNHGFDIKQFLDDKISDALLMARSSPDFIRLMLKHLKNYIPSEKKEYILSMGTSGTLSMKNYIIQFDTRWTKSYEKEWGCKLWTERPPLYYHNIGKKILTLEIAQYIDAQLPVWYSEAHQFEFADLKRNKAEQITKESLNTLVRQHIKETEHPFRLEKNKNNDNWLLMIELQKNRVLKLSLFANEIERTERRLAKLADCIQVLDSIPMYFRICDPGKHMFWEEEDYEE